MVVAGARITLDEFLALPEQTPALQGIFVDRMEQNAELFAKLMSDSALKDVVTQRLRQDVYERVRDSDSGNRAVPDL